MPSYIESFNRREIKYIVNADEFANIKYEISRRLNESEFSRCKVSSLYIDTPSRSLIARSLEKPIYKEKLRLRWYEHMNGNDEPSVFLELKKKFKGIVYKRRLCILEELAEDLMADGFSLERFHAVKRSETDAQIASEIAAFIKRNSCFEKLVATALITCKRQAFGCEDDLRVTFDTNLMGADIYPNMYASKNCNQSFNLISLSNNMENKIQLLDSDTVVVEIKCRHSYPLWLTETLSQLHVYPTSFSKYGQLYKLGA